MPDQEQPRDDGGSWFDWWSRPVVTSGIVLGAFILGVTSLILVIVGVALLFYPISVLFPILSWVGAVVVGWAAYRLVRRVL